MSETATLQVLSVQQPWADGIIHWHKWVENRSWNTKHRGTIWIHSSKANKLPDDADDLQSFDFKAPGPRHVQAIIGCVDVVDVIGQNDIEEAYWVIHKRSSRTLTARQQSIVPKLPPKDSPLWQHWCGDVFAWILANPRALVTPIPTGGKLRLWPFEVDHHLLQLVPLTRQPKAKRNLLLENS